MNASMRKIGALCSKDFRDLFKNPRLLVCCLLPIAFSAFYRFMMGRATEGVDLSAAGPEAAGALDATLSGFTLSTGICMSVGMVVGMTVLYGIAEEKEKHTLRTLMLANVSAGQISLSKGLVSLVATLVVAAACFFVGGAADASLLAPYLLACVLGALPIIFLSLVLGLAARDQMTAGLFSVPVVIVSLLPMFGMMDEGIAAVVRYLPTGGADTLVKLAVEGRLLSVDALVPLAVGLAWTVAGAAVFRLLYKRLAQDN